MVIGEPLAILKQNDVMIEENSIGLVETQTFTFAENEPFLT